MMPAGATSRAGGRDTQRMLGHETGKPRNQREYQNPCAFTHKNMLTGSPPNTSAMALRAVMRDAKPNKESRIAAHRIGEAQIEYLHVALILDCLRAGQHVGGLPLG